MTQDRRSARALAALLPAGAFGLSVSLASADAGATASPDAGAQPKKLGEVAERLQSIRLSVSDALIDTGATTLSLPTSLIRQLGLDKVSSKRVMTAGGPREANRYSAVRLIIQDRDATVDVLEVPDGCPVLVGQIPLEFMDFVVDPSNQRLIGNPAHGGEWTLEMY